jgi:hypothetical protein
MRLVMPAALALSFAAPAYAQNAIADLSYATPLGGNWSYVATAGGSEARFLDASAREQFAIRCTRATRTVTLAKPVPAGTSALAVWTSSTTRSLPATFDAATGMASAQLAAFDPLLDAMAFSRGRFGIAAPGGPPVVLPDWAELARVVEDCRV